jgi:chromate reductase
MIQNALKIVAISGSLRSNSSNSAILNIITSMVPQGIDYTIYEGIGELPHFNPVIDNDTPPATVTSFRDILREADGILICTPEYAFGVPGVLKNALDWTVSTDIFSNKPVAVITASSLGNNAHASLLLTFKALSANITEGSKLLLPYVRTKVNEKGEISDETTLQSFQSVIDNLIKNIPLKSE